MERLASAGVAKFYWDYDNSYIKEGNHNSAGLFLKKNLKIFGNDMPSDWNYNTNLSLSGNSSKRTIIETTSDIAEIKLIPELIGRLKGITPGDAHHTAVILADENLIVPALSSLPAGNFDVNITMGYPLIMTVVYTLMKHLMELQRNTVKAGNNTYFHFRDVLEILRHQLVINVLSEDEKGLYNRIVSEKMIRIPKDYLAISDSTSVLFKLPEDPGSFSEYIRQVLLLIAGSKNTGNDKNGKMQGRLINEFIYTVLLCVNRLDSLVSSGEVSFRNETYIRILDKILRSRSVPFSGEPLSGIQIMGFLETRALDFRNIIMLSVNEGILPSVSSASSFIPFSLREAFGLPVINHQESIFAYHFYRLLHRAENVSFVYNSDSTGLRTGEMSRFLIQMKYEKKQNPDIISLSFDIAAPSSIGEILNKEEHHLRSLISTYAEQEKGAVISPSAINTWLNCRMKFYYRYVNRLKEPEIFTGEFDHAMFGLILHSVMRSVYIDFIGKEISESDVDYIIKDEAGLKRKIELSVKELNKSDDTQHLDGRIVIMKDIILAYILKILSADRMIAPFRISGLEKPSFFRFSANVRQKTISVRIGGIIDRIDTKDGKTRIVDYKTGTVSDRISAIEDLFEDDRKKEPDGWLQTLIYCESLLSENPETISRPAIYNVKELSADNFSDILKIRENKNTEVAVEDYRMVRTEFIGGLQNTINRIFSPDEPFRMTTDTAKCSYCPYRSLCQR
jgi:CRISPR/Cas system-associated exonuclease Cas4 (RecB family)